MWWTLDASGLWLVVAQMSLQGWSEHLHFMIWLRALEGEITHLKYFNHYDYFCLCVGVWARMPHSVSEINFMAPVLSFSLSVGSRDQIQLSGLQSKRFIH